MSNRRGAQSGVELLIEHSLVGPGSLVQSLRIPSSFLLCGFEKPFARGPRGRMV